MTCPPEASAPGVGTGCGIDIFRAILVGKGGEATRYAFVRTQVGAQPSSDAEVAELFGKESYCAASAIGQGWAMERNPSVSSFA